MAKARHYSPAISRFLVGVLYHEAKKQRIPMTKLTEQLLAKSLRGSKSWEMAESNLVQEKSANYPVKH